MTSYIRNSRNLNLDNFFNIISYSSFVNKPLNKDFDSEKYFNDQFSDCLYSTNDVSQKLKSDGYETTNKVFLHKLNPRN